jgi:hypothetical protein
MTATASKQQQCEQPPAVPHLFNAPAKRTLILCLLLALATLALYNPVAHAPFLNYDDAIYVTNNPQVRAGLSWNTIVWTFRTPKELDWHPITWLSFALDAQLFGLNPAGYHFTNVAIHAANAVLLFLILASATGFVWRSLAVAALFALHPLNVESVAWIAERKNVLSMFFCLVALAAYGWYARRPGIGRYLAVTVAYALSLMSKAQAITFPFALLLLDYWPLARLGPSAPAPQVEDSEIAPARSTTLLKLLAEKVPWLALSAASAVITMRTGGAAFSYLALNDATESKFPLWVRLSNAAISYVQYIEKAFWPAHLALLYPHPGYAVSVRAAALSAFALIAISVAALIGWRRRPLLVGWFWFLGTMVPMTGIAVTIGPHAMADRYAYLPLIGFFVLVCWGVAELVKGWHLPLTACAAGALAVLLTIGVALHRQASLWHDNVTLWSHSLAITGDNFIAEENLAMALISAGRAREALPHFQRAHSMQPGDPLATINIATYDQMLGRYQAAIDGYEMVIHSHIAASSLLATAHANSGYAHLSLKQYENAKQDFAAALREQPVNSAAFRGLGLLAQRSGDVAEAARDYQRSVELQPSPVGYLLLGHALEVAGQPQAAREANLQAARMTQDLSDDIATVRQLLAN